MEEEKKQRDMKMEPSVMLNKNHRMAKKKVKKTSTKYVESRDQIFTKDLNFFDTMFFIKGK
jgi:hypothetical protein